MRRLLFFCSIAAILHFNTAGAQDNTNDILNNVQIQQTENYDRINKAMAAMEVVKKSGAYIESITDLLTNGVIPLPIGIKKGEYELIIRKLTYDSQTDKTYMLASCVFQLKENNQIVAFEGNIAVEGKNGIGSDGSLELIAPVAIEFGKQMTLIINSGTKCKVGCEGVDIFNAKLDLLITSELIIPVDNNGNETGKVIKAGFDGTFTDFENFTASFKFDNAFKIRNVNDIIFYIAGATIDNSDTETSAMIQFPQNYFTGDIEQERKLWKGLYITESSIALPAIFKKKSNSQLNDTDKTITIKAPPDRIVVAMKNTIVDENGFSGLVYAKDLLLSETLDRKKWDISLHEFGFGIQKNNIEKLAFEGDINIPPLGDNSLLGYNAKLNFVTSEYEFQVNLEGTYQFEVLKSKLSLNENSYVEVLFKGSEIYPKIDASGTLSIDAPIGTGDSKFAVPDIKFEGLSLSREQPYFSVRALALTGNITPPKIGGFEFTISDLNSFNNNGNTGLSFNATVGVSEQFGGTAGLKLYGDYMQWKFQRAELSAIGIKYNSTPFSITGNLFFIDTDPVYGKGFRGDILLEVIEKFQFKAIALFGNINNYRYFLTDVFMEMQPTSGLFVPPVLSFYGFGGGMYQRMNQSYNPSVNSEMGKSLSGINYIPDPNVGMGFMASTKFGLIGSANAFNSLVSLEMQFNRNWGLNFVQFRGDAAFMTSPGVWGDMASNVQEKIKSKSKIEVANKSELNNRMPKNKGNSMCSASVNIMFDQVNKVFSADLVTYLNVAGVVKGIGPGNRLVWASAYFSPDEWYTYIGTPTDRAGISVANFMQVNGYFMIGDNIPELPPPPAKVTRNLSLSNMNSLTRKPGLINSGNGIAFGVGVQQSFYARLPPFYGGFAAGAGAEFLLKNYGEGAYCIGRSGTLGINGWYASAQVWAFVEAEIGLTAKVFKKVKNFQILSLSAGALLGGSGPNPLYLYGAVGGRYSVMGGMISGQCDFDFEMGDKCIVAGGNPLGIDIIKQITPEHDETDVNVFTVPQLILNIPVNLPMAVDGQIYRISLNEFYLKNKETGQKYSGTVKILKEGKLVTLELTDPLESEKNMEIIAIVGFQRWFNNRWITETEVNGNPVIESKSVTFKSGLRPSHILPEHVVYSYPIDRQFNYYPNEYSKGYIQVKYNYEYLFTTDKPEGFEQKIKLTDANGKVQITNFTHTKVTGNSKVQFEVNFSTNEMKFKNNEIYKLQITNIPVNQNIDMARNITAQTEKSDQTKGMDINTLSAEGTVELLREKSIYSINFRCSNYNTFAQKIKEINIDGYGSRVYMAPFVHYINGNIVTNEFFDKFEVPWDNGKESLIKAKAILNKTEWYKNAYRDMYNTQPLTQNIKNERALYDEYFNDYGYAPEGSVFIRNDNTDKTLTDTEIETGQPIYPDNIGVIRLHLPLYCAKDMYYIKDEIARKAKYQTISNTEQELLKRNYPIAVTKGNYPVNITYTLPGKNIVTSTIDVSLVNPVN